MKTFCFSELCKKEVISIDCGKKLGYPQDIQIDCKCGQLLYILLTSKNTFSLFSGKNCIKIPWCDVQRIGEDVIWVKGRYEGKDDCCDRNYKSDKGCCD